MSQTNNLSFYLKKLAKEEQIKSTGSRRKEKVIIRVKINDIEKGKTLARIKTNSQLFENIN